MIGSAASSISGQVETFGTRRITSIVSRKTREFAGFAAGSRNASDSATSFSEGTVRRPRRDALPLRTERELQKLPGRLFGLRALCQAVGVRVEDPGRLLVLRQRHDVPVEAGDRPEGRRRAARRSTIARRPLRNRVSSSSASRSWSLGMTRCLSRRSKKACIALSASGVSSGEAGRLLFVVDELAPHRPQEGRQADDRRLDADAVLVDVPSPSSSRVSLIAFWTMSFHVHPDLGSATPARRKRSRL